MVYLRKEARSGDGLSPREVFTGLKPDYKRVVPVAFGTFCQVKEKKTNTLATRSVTAIALLQTGHGPFKFTSLYTGRVITRLQFRPMQTRPHEHILILNSMQERRRIGTEDLLSPDTDVEETKSTLNIVNLALGDATQQNMNIKEAFRVFGEVKTRESVKKELQNMLDKDVKLFLKIKDDGSLKSRLVAGGHRQSKDVYERKSSPTVGTSAIFILAVAAKKYVVWIATLGLGAIYATSTKQKCVSKSSTEAELIAATDLVSEGLHLKGLCEFICDKKVHLLKHVRIRLNWIKNVLRVETSTSSIRNRKV